MNEYRGLFRLRDERPIAVSYDPDEHRWYFGESDTLDDILTSFTIVQAWKDGYLRVTVERPSRRGLARYLALPQGEDFILGARPCAHQFLVFGVEQWAVPFWRMVVDERER